MNRGGQSQGCVNEPTVAIYSTFSNYHILQRFKKGYHPFPLRNHCIICIIELSDQTWDIGLHVVVNIWNLWYVGHSITLGYLLMTPSTNNRAFFIIVLNPLDFDRFVGLRGEPFTSSAIITCYLFGEANAVVWGFITRDGSFIILLRCSILCKSSNVSSSISIL